MDSSSLDRLPKVMDPSRAVESGPTLAEAGSERAEQRIRQNEPHALRHAFLLSDSQVSAHAEI
jgi:hypothetical protein